MQKSKGEQQFDSESLDGVSLPLPPPLVKVTEPADLHPDIPGDLTTVENEIRKTYYTYERPMAYLRDSMNNWLSTVLPQNLFNMPIVIDRHIKIRITDVKHKPPTTADGRPIYPIDAESNRLTLTSQILVQLSLIYQETPESEEELIDSIDNVSLGFIPVMTGTIADNTYNKTDMELFELGQCISDRDTGYFIINGVPKIITIRKKLRENRFISFMKDKSAKEPQQATLGRGIDRAKVTFVYGNVGDVRVQLKALGSGGSDNKKNSRDLNVYHLFSLLDPDLNNSRIIQARIIEYAKNPKLAWSNLITTMLEYETHPGDVYDIIAAITDNKMRDIELRNRNIRETILSELFPQTDISTDEATNMLIKVNTLAYAVCKYIETIGKVRPLDQRDPVGNSMYETPGMAYGRFFFEVLKTALEGDNNSLRTKINSDSTFNVKITSKATLLERVDQVTRARAMLNSIKKHIDGSVVKIISSNMESAFTNGWSLKNNKENIVDTLKEEGPVMRYSQSTRINIPTSSKGKQFEQRSIKMSQAGYICVIDSPEGQKIGLVEHVAITTYLTQYIDDSFIVQELTASLEQPNLLPQVALNKDTTSGMDTIIILNGKVMFWCNGDEMYNVLLNYRRSGTPYPETDLAFIDNKTMLLYNREFHELLIYTDAGRAVRPLLIVNPETKRLVIDELNLWDANFETLLANHAVEYVDAAEIEYLQGSNGGHGRVAQTIKMFSVDVRNRERLLNQLKQMEPEYLKETDKQSELSQKYLKKTIKFQRADAQANYSHCEMNPSSVMGFSASLIPLANHTSGAKNVFQCAMAKQAMSAVNIQHSIRFPTAIKVLSYPERPLFENQMVQNIGLDSMPAGQNVIVAMTPYFGWNQEDAIIFNKASVDRGLFHYTVYKTVKAAVKNTNQFNMVIERGKLKATGNRPDPYRNLDSQGVIKIGSRVEPGDILVSMVRKSRTNTGDTQADDVSVKVPLGVRGVVDKVYKIKSNNTISEVKIKIRDVRKPEPSGDKFSSRYAQKGVTGIMLPAEDMPFTSDGRQPDVIINPLGFISRMTVGKVIEIVTGKVALMRGERIDSTSFREFDIDSFRRELARLGYRESGGDNLYIGTDGEMMEAVILMGPCYYQSLRHHVRDKIQARARGAIKIDTFQPVKGKAKGGGSRFGRQEREALVTHGAAYAIRDIFLLSSDAIDMVYCTTCGTVCEIDISGSKKCHMCGPGARFAKCQITGPFKALTHYMAGQGINVRADIRQIAQKTDYGLDPLAGL